VRCFHCNWIFLQGLYDLVRLFYTYVGFEVFTAVTMKTAVFWDVALCRSSVNRRFRGTYRLHLQGSHLLTLVPRSRTFLPWRWRRYIPPKHRFTQDPHSDTSQKTAVFIFYSCLRLKIMFSFTFTICGVMINIAASYSVSSASEPQLGGQVLW
jgi:hypothetical protein